MKIGIIAAMTPDGIIGIDGDIPWHYKADLQCFKRKTMDSSIIFGANTYESLPGRLGGRVVFVVSRRYRPLKECPPAPGAVQSSLKEAIYWAKVWTKTETVWIGGGGEIYRLALRENLVDFIDLTIVPPVEIRPGAKITRFPVDLLVGWSLIEEAHPDDSRLLQRRYERLP